MIPKSKKLAKKRTDKRQTMLRKKFEGKKETIKNKGTGKEFCSLQFKATLALPRQFCNKLAVLDHLSTGTADLIAFAFANRLSKKRARDVL